MSSWAENRRKLLITIGISGALALAVLIAVPIIYDTPSCADGKQNQGEQGIDCGGACAYLCSAQVEEASVRFVRTLAQSNRTDLIAYIDNPNRTAATRATYRAELFDASGAPLGIKEGTIDLPPQSTVPLFIPGILATERDVAQAFVELTDKGDSWFTFTKERIAPKISGTQIEQGETVKISAMVENPSYTAMRNVRLIATVFDAERNVIAASQTIVPVIQPQGSARAVFTWNESFDAVPTRVEVLHAPSVDVP